MDVGHAAARPISHKTSRAQSKRLARVVDDLYVEGPSAEELHERLERCPVLGDQLVPYCRRKLAEA